MVSSCILFLFLWIGHLTAASIRDETEVVACHDEAVQIQCRRRESAIAVYLATFSTLPGMERARVAHCDRRTSTVPTDAPASNDTCADDVRLIVNQRCSGSSSCSFRVADLVPRECYGAGVFTLRYGCISVSNVVKYCNVKVEGSTAEGFIQNPGYPNFYPGLNRCTWSVTGSAGQRVLVSVLDLTLQPNPGSSAVDCGDSLQLFDGSIKVMHVCGWDIRYLYTFTSVSQSIKIVFTSRDVWPSRGFLIYYRVLGCATLPAPLHGYLVYRNASLAHYMCCARHAFVDDLKRNRILHCDDGNKWNGTVSSCRHVKILREWKNVSEAEFEDDGYADNDPIRQVVIPHVDFIYDVLIPSVIMAAMVISNVLIVLIILRLRRRAKQRSAGSNGSVKHRDPPLMDETPPSTSSAPYKKPYHNGFPEYVPRRSAPLVPPNLETGL